MRAVTTPRAGSVHARGSNYNARPMTSPQPHRRIVPPTLPPPAERAGVAYTPPQYVPPQRMDRWKRNLLVWTICVVVIFLALSAFVSFYLS